MISEIKASDAFEEGYNAAIDGLVPEDNPYPKGSEDHALWSKGFLAFEEEDIDA
ncbi:hypothetical protein [Methyloterricola oryzae]|uniref:hypothetical protein n=1 Tax=Methyloterricola oryzae TaxID=1495050 RepID=UPI0019108757|nr:hypothetical protein [Methyloterricola oryzae]